MGEEVPDPIKDAPELRQDLYLYLEAFYELDTERTDGLIPWSCIVRYGTFHGFDMEQMDNLLCYTRLLDDKITAHRNAKLKSSMKTSKRGLKK